MIDKVTYDEREKRIEAYKQFYKLILENIKLPQSFVYAWYRLRQEVENKMLTLNDLSTYDLEPLSKKLEDFIKANLNNTAAYPFIHCFCELHNKKIDLVRKNPPINYNNIKDDVERGLNRLANILSADKRNTDELKRMINNHYESLQIIYQCLEEKGLMLHEINKRIDYQRFNIMITTKIDGKRKAFCHLNIDKSLMEEYAELHNNQKNIALDGEPILYHIQNAVVISKTRLKKDEIPLYRERKKIKADASFIKDSICEPITSEKIKREIADVPLNRDTLDESNQLSLPDLKDEVQRLISIARTREALNIIATWARKRKKTDTTDNIIVVNAELATLENNEIIGILTSKEITLQYNQLNKRILNIIKNFK